MAVSAGIAATIAVVVVVVVVIVGLMIYCLCWKTNDEEEQLETHQEKQQQSTSSISRSAVLGNRNIMMNNVAMSNNNNNNNNSAASIYYSPPVTGRSTTSTSMNFQQQQRSPSHQSQQSNNNSNNFYYDDELPTTSIVPIPSFKSNHNNNSHQHQSNNNNSINRNGRLEHIPVSQRISDGTHLYYTFVSEHDNAGLTNAISKTAAAAKEMENYLKKGKVLTAKKIAKKKREANDENGSVAEVFELSLNEVGLGSETDEYVSFALLCELAVKHLPDQCDWQQGEVPPLRLVSVDLEEAKENYSPDLVVSDKVISVVDAEAFVASREAIRDTKNDPLVLMIIDDEQSNLPSSVPVPWKKPKTSSIKPKASSMSQKKQNKKYDDNNDDDGEQQEEEEEEAFLHKSYHDANQDISVNVSGIYSPRQLKQMKKLKKRKKRSSSTVEGAISSSARSSSSSSSVNSSSASSVSISVSQNRQQNSVSFDFANNNNSHKNLSPQQSRSSSSANRSRSQTPNAILYNNNNYNQLPYFPTLQQNNNRGSSQSSAMTAASSNVSSRTPLFANYNSNGLEAAPDMTMPILAPRIYPYSPVITTKTPVRITAVQYRCRKTGVFIQDRWKVFALDEVLTKLPLEFMNLVALARRVETDNNNSNIGSQPPYASPSSILKKKKTSTTRQSSASYSNFDDSSSSSSSDGDDDDESSSDYSSASDVLRVLAATQKPPTSSHHQQKKNDLIPQGSTLDKLLPKTFEFSSRKSTASSSNSNNINNNNDQVVQYLPHLSVTVSRDGTLFVKSVPKTSSSSATALKQKKGSKRKSSSKKKKEVTINEDLNQQHHHQQHHVSTASNHSESGDSSSQHSSYLQSTVQLLHVDVVPMSFSYKIESSTSTSGSGGSSFAPWKVVECLDDSVSAQNHVNYIKYPNQQSSLAKIGAHEKDYERYLPPASTIIYLPFLGRVCVMARTMKVNNNNRTNGSDPSWSTVFTVNATNKEDTRDYSEYAALHFAGI